MKKLFDYPLCFADSLREAIKYVLSPLSQLNLKDSFNALANMQVKKRIQEKKKDF